MTAQRRPQVRRKSDRLLSPGSSKEEQAVDSAIAPFDRAAKTMERKWGYDRLQELVPPAMAAKYGMALALMNEAIDNKDPDAAAATAANCIKGLAAMEAAAIAAGHQPPRAIACYELDGFSFRIVEDAGDPTPDDGIQAFTLREVAVALRAQLGRVPEVVREHFPRAEVTAIRTTSNIIDDDFIPF